jgi:FG-GAP-like repeat
MEQRAVDHGELELLRHQSPQLNFGEDSPWDTIAGDFNGDHRSDYARLGGTGAWVFFGNPDGTFTRRFQSYADGFPLNFGQPSTWQVVTGDFNADTRVDYARLGGTGAWVFFGNPDGTFTRTFQSYVNESPPLDFGESSAWQAIAGDFNGDGRGDYARLGSTGAWVFSGNADRTFTRSFQTYPASMAFGLPSPFQVVTGDFNGHHRTSYARLGGTQAFVFLHEERLAHLPTLARDPHGGLQPGAHLRARQLLQRAHLEVLAGLAFSFEACLGIRVGAGRACHEVWRPAASPLGYRPSMLTSGQWFIVRALATGSYSASSEAEGAWAPTWRFTSGALACMRSKWPGIAPGPSSLTAKTARFGECIERFEGESPLVAIVVRGADEMCACTDRPCTEAALMRTSEAVNAYQQSH